MKKNSGFTFAEVLLALSVLATSMYLYSNLQFRSMFKIQDSRDVIDRIFFVKKALYESFLDPEFKRDKPRVEKLETPQVTITTHKQDVDKKKSELKDFAQTIDIIWSEGVWKSGLRDRRTKMISFVFKEEESGDEQ